jgi:RNA polymerase sigma-70 factor (ECF subfamily)
MPAHRASDIEAVLETARSAWPDVHVPPAEFRDYVLARTAGDALPSPETAAALYLACGCVRGDPAALRAFDRSYLSEIPASIRRMRLPPDQVDELVQGMRQHLLVGRDGAPPKIADYSGHGDLRGWLRVTATRNAIRAARKQSPASLDDVDSALEARSADDDPELSYMKALYRDAFRTAFHAALESLEPREKNLLRQHFVDGLTVDDVGRMYGVHRATAARWIVKARDDLLDRTRTAFAERAGVGARECNSVLRLVQSRLDVTLRRLLA